MAELVYIAGLSRSGSTLLELLLGAHDRVVTTGELQVWPHEIGHPVGVIDCGCGSTVGACDFWNEVRALVDPLTQPPPRLNRFRETHYWGYTNRPSLWRDMVRTSPGAAPSAAEQQYGANTSQIVDAVAKTWVARGVCADYVVDASKDPYRAWWLARSDASNVRIVHLVRDPRAAVASLLRDQNITSAAKRIEVASRRAMAWNVENTMIRTLTRDHLAPDRSTLVYYEALASEPVRELKRLAEFIGVTADPTTVDRYQTNLVHTVAGNPMRGERRPIRLDTRWKTELEPQLQRLVRTITAPVRRHFTDQTHRYEETAR